MMHGWPVLSVLLIVSIISMTIILERWILLRNARLNPRAFVARILDLLESGSASKALQLCDQYPQPIAKVVSEVLLQPGGREDKERAMRHAIQEQIFHLEQRIPFLGTIGSTAPFIGLLGTVAGIIKSFRDIAMNAGGGPDVVSAGIAEALVTTAFGLLVAIPAVMFYNYFINSIRRLSEDLELSVYYLIEKQTQDDHHGYTER
jgi:biopolymer transport protein ExbB